MIAGDDLMFRQRLTIYINILLAHLHMIARQPDYALHIIHLERSVVRSLVADGILGVAGILENDNVAAANFALWQERKSRTWGENKFVDQQMIPDGDRVLNDPVRGQGRRTRQRIRPTGRHAEVRPVPGHRRAEILLASGTTVIVSVIVMPCGLSAIV